MKPIALLLLPLFCPAAVLPSDVSAVVDLARSAPGEFAADALIRVAALDRLEKPRRIELLEEAFRRASEAQEPLKREAAIARAGGPASFLNRAYGQDLDALSLRMRAVEAMLVLDKRKARELFQQMPPLEVPKVACEQSMVYNVDRYYAVLGQIAKQSYTPKETARNEPVRLLEQAVRTLTSSAQVKPAALMTLNAGLKDQDLQLVSAALAGALGKIMGDDRTFTHYSVTTGPAILDLVNELKQRKLNPLPLVEGYRLYLVNNLAGDRCADDDLMQNGANSYSMATGRAADALGGEAAAFYNRQIRMSPLQPLSENEMTPSKLEGAAAGLRSCRDKECASISEQYRVLVFDAGGRPLRGDEKNTPEWRAMLQQFLTAMASWTASTDASETEFFREKSEFYNALIAALPNGPTRQDVLRSWLDFLQKEHNPSLQRIEWLLPVNTLIGRVSLDPLGVGKIADELRQVKDPVIALYVELERLAPRTPDRIMSLL